ncbi:hypothetical protein [uncultured Pluralibacter sp.]|uniref:hypothetical protein n=1 Tax=uncultured Pluralibacter sp. TaxID=1490864 RepID=UPI00263203E1|nr:hypothetical protein [uncultured Pluralibacter sp.]
MLFQTDQNFLALMLRCFPLHYLMMPHIKYQAWLAILYFLHAKHLIATAVKFWVAVIKNELTSINRSTLANPILIFSTALSENWRGEYGKQPRFSMH